MDRVLREDKLLVGLLIVGRVDESRCGRLLLFPAMPRFGTQSVSQPAGAGDIYSRHDVLRENVRADDAGYVETA